MGIRMVPDKILTLLEYLFSEFLENFSLCSFCAQQLYDRGIFYQDNMQELLRDVIQ
jgi:hypothetical protein